MVAQAGTYRDGELWLRCPFCGDSTYHPTRAHFSVNTSGVYHCLRCKAKGRMPLRRLIPLMVESGALDHEIQLRSEDEEWSHVFDKMLPGPATTRFSALDRFHLRTLIDLWDAFLSRDVHGTVAGIALVSKKKGRRKFHGEKLLGWKGEHLESDPDNPLRIVEGPYDVMSTRDVCAFGIPSESTLKMLRGHFVLLCPDGDVWNSPGLKRSIQRTLRWTQRGAFVVGVEVLPDGLDPDEVPYEDRDVITVQQVLRM